MKVKILKGALVRPFGRVSVGDEYEVEDSFGLQLIGSGVAEPIEVKAKKKKATKKKDK